MVVDSSAVLAILFGEPEGDHFSMAILSASRRLMSVVNAFEAGIVADSSPVSANGPAFDRLLQSLQIELSTVTVEQAALARSAYRRFGKGRHPARLNLGDCFAYALSTATGEQLLFKGDDFALTDVERAG